MPDHHNMPEAGSNWIENAIAAIVAILWNVIIPFLHDKISDAIDWFWHTIGAIATGLIVTYCVHRFRKWLKKQDVQE